MKHIDIGLFDSLGAEPSRLEPKQRNRKPRKQNEKEILKENREEVSREREHSASKQRSIYENYQYLSPNEKNIFEAKFTKPKTIAKRFIIAY